MKVLLLGFAKMKIMPYANFYLEQIDSQKNEVHIVYWNRDLKDEDLSKYKDLKLHEFREEINDSISSQRKLKHFWKYRKFVKNILKSNKFDFIISLHTFPGLLILDSLLLRYNHKYILDYRDSTFEENPIFGYFIKVLASHSALVFTSSDGFRKYLPTSNKVEIITSHNILTDSLLHRDDRGSFFIPHEKIRICFWGIIRHKEHNLLMISKLANDSRFEIHYYGKEQLIGKELKDYCSNNFINNVYFHGEYVPEDRYSFILTTDIIHNSYYDNNMQLAMANKYYDGIIFRIPQLCMLGSYMAQRCLKNKVGCAFSPYEEDYANKIYQYYSSLDWSAFNNACDRDLENVLDEYNYGIKRVKDLIK